MVIMIMIMMRVGSRMAMTVMTMMGIAASQFSVVTTLLLSAMRASE